MRGRKARIAVLVASVVAVMMGGMTSAKAVGLPITCITNAVFNITPGTGTGLQTWSVDMQGTCNGDFQGPYTATGTATGTSVGAGLCGGLVMTNLDLTAVLHLQSRKGPAFDKTLIEKWTAPVTTYPIATPFLINGVMAPQSRSTVGAGTMSTRLLGPLVCPPKGAPTGEVISVRL